MGDYSPRLTYSHELTLPTSPFQDTANSIITFFDKICFLAIIKLGKELISLKTWRKPQSGQTLGLSFCALLYIVAVFIPVEPLENVVGDYTSKHRDKETN